MKEYSPLTMIRLQTGITFRRPSQVLPSRVTLASPAVDSMTDFRQVTAVTIQTEATLEEANERMIRHDVRLLLVVNHANVVVGLITATDILGEKPLRLVRDRGLKRSEILVGDLMTPHDMLEAIPLEAVLAAKIGDIVATLKQAGRQHTLVVDLSDEGSTQIVRGLFSASQIARQLGVPVHITEVARTFAEIEAMVNH
jgi:CBS domain-containing protein